MRTVKNNRPMQLNRKELVEEGETPMSTIGEHTSRDEPSYREEEEGI
jgi:hypothetical protein